jgi:probable HAF family extracellular repeat protein
MDRYLSRHFRAFPLVFGVVFLTRGRRVISQNSFMTAKTAILTAFALGLLTGAAHAIQYTITNLDPNDPTSLAVSINDLGKVPVVLYAATPGVTSFVYEHERRINLPGYANGINDKGQICGTLFETSPRPRVRAYIYSNRKITLINDGGFPGLSEANGINRYGEVAGDFEFTKGLRDAFSWKNGIFKDLGSLGGSSFAYGINNNGQIVGGFITSTGAMHAFLYTNDRMQDLGAPVGDDTQAMAINDHGQIVGAIGGHFGYHAFLYANGFMRDLGALPNQSCAASGINNSGVIIGNFGFTGGFVYVNGQMYDAATLVTDQSWTTVQPNAINDRGQIAGLATKADGVYHAVLLTPVVDCR